MANNNEQRPLDQQTSSPPCFINAQVEKLQDGTNYNAWKFAMKAVLTLEGLWDQIEKAENATLHPVRDQRALARISLSLHSNCYQYVRNISTAHGAWNKLAEIFENAGFYRRVILLRQLHRAQYSHYSSMTEYINAVMTLVQQLADIKRVIDDAEVAEILLSGLPEQFDVLVSSLETACLTSTLTSELVRNRLLQEEMRRNENEGAGAYAALKKKHEKKRIICDFCKRTGHIAKKCFKKKRMEEKKEAHVLYATAYTAVHSQDKEFIVDSGANAHMCNEGQLEEKPEECVSCLEGKMHAKPFPQREHRAAKPLELVHADVCGPMQVDSYGGARYLLCFIDDNTRKIFGYLLKHKSEMGTIGHQCLTSIATAAGAAKTSARVQI